MGVFDIKEMSDEKKLCKCIDCCTDYHQFNDCIFCFNYKYKYQKEFPLSIRDIYFLEGENSDWSLKNGILILGDHKQYFNAETIAYIGNANIKIYWYQATVYIKDETSNIFKDQIFTVEHDSREDLKDLLDNNNLTLGEASKLFEKPERYNFNIAATDSIYLDIKYLTNTGLTITNTIKLNAKRLDQNEFKAM